MEPRIIGVVEMTRRINYEDNIFFLNLVFKGVRAALKLNIDTELFSNRIAGDIEFLDQMSARILESLKANTLMIERMAHLKELHKLNEKLCGLLDDILQQRLSACSALERHFGSLQRVLSRREAEQTELTTLVEAGRSSASDQEQIVSQEEFAFLLSPEEGEHGEQDKP